MKQLVILAMVSIVAAFIISAESFAKKPPAIEQGPNAEVSFDGLHLVDKTRMDKVWAKPDIDLSQYDKVIFEGAGIQYRAVKDGNRHNRSADAFPLSERQKSGLEKAAKEAFRSEFNKFEYFTVASKPGAGILKVTLALIDVVSHVPPKPLGRNSFYISNLGQAILVVELSDSVTNEILVRAVDGQGINLLAMQESNPVTNLNEVKRSVRRWGVTLREGLDELHEIGSASGSFYGITDLE
jgi:hypothetical protein